MTITRLQQTADVASQHGDATEVSASAPKIAFGVPVRNAVGVLPRLLDSLLAQSEPDLEVIICDNGSDDGSVALCTDYAARDQRVRFFDNGGDIGQIANFNRTLELARAPVFRWIGADDWLEPTYAERCLDALGQHPGAVGVTTFQDHLDDSGRRHYREYRGERLDSPNLGRRFARMMWAFTADYRYFDPIYSAMRRDVLLQSRRLQIVPNTDQVLAAELITYGPFVHVAECLAHRRRDDEVEDEGVYRRYAPSRHRELDPTVLRLFHVFLPIPWRVPGSGWQRLRCLMSVLRHCAVTASRRLRDRLRTALRPLKQALSRR